LAGVVGVAARHGVAAWNEDIDWTIRLARAGHVPIFDSAARLWHRPTRTTARAM
jgi:hypothetical protein